MKKSSKIKDSSDFCIKRFNQRFGISRNGSISNTPYSNYLFEWINWQNENISQIILKSNIDKIEEAAQNHAKNTLKKRQKRRKKG